MTVVPFLLLAFTGRAQVTQSTTDPLNQSQLKVPPPQICEGHSSDRPPTLSLGGQSLGSKVQARTPQDLPPEQDKPLTPIEPQASAQAKDAAGQEDVVKNQSGRAAPMVTYAGGMITVRPGGSTMRKVLQAMSARTGITVDLPGTGLDSRIFDEQIGPAPVREALLQLLYGSGLNYIVQYTLGDPATVKRLVVSTQSEYVSAADRQIASGSGIKTVPNVETADQMLDGGAEEQPPEESQPLMSGPAPNVPGIPANFNLKEAAAQANKTPAQMLDELQKRQLEILRSQAPQP